MQDKGNEVFSYYDSVKSVVPKYHISVEQLHARITGADRANCRLQIERVRAIQGQPKPERQALKESILPCVSPHGTFSKRNKDGLLRLSGLIITDIDAYGSDLSQLKAGLKRDPFVRLVFEGPSGPGSLKLLWRIDPALVKVGNKSNQFEDIFNGIEGYMRERYADMLPDLKDGETILDEASKDLARCCFLSYDPDAHINPFEGERVDAHFIEEFSCRPAASATAVSPASVKVERTPARSLQALAIKHLKPKKSHHHELIKFVCAAEREGYSQDAVLSFLQAGDWIDPTSGESDPAKLDATIQSLYSLYAHHGADVEVLVPGRSIKYEYLTFRSSKERGWELEGIFWHGILKMLEAAGYCRRRMGKGFILVRKQAGVIEEAVHQDMLAFVQSKIVERGSVSFDAWGHVFAPVEAIMEAFVKTSHNIFNDGRLAHLPLDDTPLLKDTDDSIFLPFRNGIVTLKAFQPVQMQAWEDIKGYVLWKDCIIPHDFQYTPKYDAGVFFTFCHNITNGDEERMFALVTGIGYMMHHYFRESEGQAVILYDENIKDPNKPSGGSGKGVIANAIKRVRKTAKVDGKHFDERNRFRWEAVGPDTQVVWMDDAKKDFDFSILHSNLTDGWTIERKFQPQFVLPPADSPKTIISSNNILKGEGTTNVRRQHIVEVGDYYSSKIKRNNKPIEEEHGGLFWGKTWSQDEWDMFYSFMVVCGKAFLESGLKAADDSNVERNKLRLRTSNDFVQWVEGKGLEPKGKDRGYKTKDLFEEYRDTFFGDDETTFKQINFSKFINYFADSRGWEVDRWKSNGTAYFRFIDPSAPKDGGRPAGMPKDEDGPPHVSDNDSLQGGEDLPF